MVFLQFAKVVISSSDVVEDNARLDSCGIVLIVMDDDIVLQTW